PHRDGLSDVVASVNLARAQRQWQTLSDRGRDLRYGPCGVGAQRAAWWTATGWNKREGGRTMEGMRRSKTAWGMVLIGGLVALLLPATGLAKGGHDSCVGGSACDGNTGDVGNGSCNGFEACVSNSGDMGNTSCVGDSACRRNTGAL